MFESNFKIISTKDLARLVRVFRDNPVDSQSERAWSQVVDFYIKVFENDINNGKTSREALEHVIYMEYQSERKRQEILAKIDEAEPNPKIKKRKIIKAKKRKIIYRMLAGVELIAALIVLVIMANHNAPQDMIKWISILSGTGFLLITAAAEYDPASEFPEY